MTLPPELIQRLEPILEPFGGYSVASQIINEDTLGNLALFNGYTLVMTPFTDNETNLPIPLIDLAEFGYKEGLTISTIDNKYNFIYNQIITPTIVEGQAKYLFGTSLADVNLLDAAPNGGLYYLLFNTDPTRVLIALLVCKTINVSDKNYLLNEWREVVAERGKVDYQNELLIQKYGAGNIRVWVYTPASTNETITEDKILYYNQSEIIDRETGLYLNFKADSWFMLSEYTLQESLPTNLQVLLKTLPNIYEDELTTLGYTRKNRTTWVSGTSVLELNLDQQGLLIGIDSYIDTPLTLQTIYGNAQNRLTALPQLSGRTIYKLNIKTAQSISAVKNKYLISKSEGFKITAVASP